jgi:hypothetical protein
MAKSTPTPSVLTDGSQHGITFYTPAVENPQVLRSLSLEQIQKMKYKIELG